MANTWRKGHFGLTLLSGVNRRFDELSVHFDDNLDGNYIDRDITADETFSVVTKSIPTYVNVNIPSDTADVDVPITADASYTAVEESDEPIYDNIGINA